MTSEELKGIAHELKFWQGFVQTKRFLDGWVKDIPTPELNQNVYRFIKDHLPKNGHVLDVGSGVVSILNGTVPQRQLTAFDPLGGLYELIFDYKKYGINPPMTMPAEEIDIKNNWDIVHISNALDHTQDPVEAYIRLLDAVKPGGYLIVQGFENEALHEGWKGFHQFNLQRGASGFIEVTGKSGEKRILNQCDKIIISETVPALDRQWIIFIAQK